jgi:FkbM family methyltransferase
VNHRLVQAQKFVRLVVDPHFRRGIRFGVGASVEHLGMMRGRDIATLVDIGANVGQFSLLVTGLLPDVRVEAFEPLRGPAGIFQKLFAGNPRVTLHRVAIGAQQKEASMNVSRREDSSSLLGISVVQTTTFPGTEKVGVENVRVTTLDAELDPSRIVAPALLKLDVQGYELEALRGCASMLHLFDLIYAELSFVELYEGQALAHEVIEFLSDKGFDICGVYNTQSDPDGRSIQCDCLFRRHAGSEISR